MLGDSITLEVLAVARGWLISGIWRVSISGATTAT
jgi:hypothetical protein